MKSLKKFIFRLFCFGLITTLSIYIGLFLYFQFSWPNYYAKQQVDSYIESVKNTPVLADSFYLVYDKFYSDRHERITTRYLKSFWGEFFMFKQPKRNNWQLIAARMAGYKGYRYKLAPMALAFKINRELPPEKCFDYVMTKMYADYSNKFKLCDTINNLKATEKIIDFIVASEQPSYFRRHPAEYKRKTDSLRNKLKMQ